MLCFFWQSEKFFEFASPFREWGFIFGTRFTETAFFLMCVCDEVGGFFLLPFTRFGPSARLLRAQSESQTATHNTQTDNNFPQSPFLNSICTRFFPFLNAPKSWLQKSCPSLRALRVCVHIQHKHLSSATHLNKCVLHEFEASCWAETMGGYAAVSA